MRRGPLVAFLGPSLPAREARRIAPGCVVLPPARQGDVWRALSLRPRAIALVDGVFESEPSVWHHEILAALDGGVRVVGGASMGALRAAELAAHGMEGAGRIFAWVRGGRVRDDAEVALLHGAAEHGFRALTVPLVEVRWAAERARLRPAEARALVEAAGAIFYQQRRWPAVLEAAGPRLPARALAKVARLVRRGFPSLKALDARACLRLAAAPGRGRPGPPRKPAEPSSLVRRRRLLDAESRPGPVRNGSVLHALRARASAGELAAQGLRRLLLAELARSLALEPSAKELERAEAGWLRQAGVSPAGREAFFAASGLARDDARALCATLAREELALEHAARLFPDGPALDEGLALEARLRGEWRAVARQLAARSRPR